VQEFHGCAKKITVTGSIPTAFCKIELKDLGGNPKKPDRNVFVSINTCANTAPVKVLGIRGGAGYQLQRYWERRLFAPVE
jgi:hypothetical protein